MKHLKSILALLLIAFATPLQAQEISLPAELKGQPGRLLRIEAKTDCKQVKWIVSSPDADLIPLSGDGKQAIFSTGTPGTYRIYAFTAKGDVPSDAATSVVQIGQPGPPPVPPTPNPPTPPSDPLTTELRGLYTADSGPNKADHLKLLCELYRFAATQTQDPKIDTAGKLQQALRSASIAVIPPTSLVSLRKRVGEVLSESLPSSPEAPLTPENRQRAKAAFERISLSLCEVNK